MDKSSFKKCFFVILIKKIKRCFSKKKYSKKYSKNTNIKNASTEDATYKDKKYIENLDKIKTFRNSLLEKSLFHNLHDENNEIIKLKKYKNTNSIEINGELYYYSNKLLGSGRNGVVREYKGKNTTLAIKVFKNKYYNELKRERRAITYLKVCNNNIIIPCATVKDYKIIIMEKADSDVFNLVSKGLLEMKDIKSIFAQVCLGLDELLKNNLYYLDLKLENLLCNYVNGEYIVYFGDIGSINAENEDTIITTFTPPHAWLQKNYKLFLKETSNVKIEVLKFCLGYLLMLLIFPYNKTFIHFINYTKDISRFTKEYYDDISKNSSNRLNAIYNDFNKSYLDIYPIINKSYEEGLISSNQYQILTNTFYKINLKTKLDKISLQEIIQLGINDFVEFNN